MKRTLISLLTAFLLSTVANAAEGAVGLISFKNAELKQVLLVYSELSGLQVLVGRGLSGGQLALTLEISEPVSKAEAMKRIEKGLLEQAGIVITHLDDHRVSVGYDFTRPPVPVATNSVEGAFMKFVSPSEVDPKSVSLSGADSPQPHVVFKYASKAPEEVRAIAREHPEAPVLVMKGKLVIARAAGCTGYKEWVGAGPDRRLDYVGLDLVFDRLDQARLAERALKRED